MEAKPPPTAKQRDKIPPPHVGHRDFLPPALRRDNPSGRFTAPFSLPQADRQVLGAVLLLIDVGAAKFSSALILPRGVPMSNRTPSI
jgi:hypothetical protein